MKTIYCYTHLLPEGTQAELSFLELLLDENWSRGLLCFPPDLFQHTGPLNQKLPSKRNYEFLLRAAKICPVTVVGCGDLSSVETDDDINLLKEILPKETIPKPSPEAIWLTPEAEPECSSREEALSHAWDSYRTDCYILGKYQEDLLENDCFQAVTEALLSLIPSLPDSQAAVSFMEQMISRSPAYYAIDDAVAPILLYTGDSTCFSTLDHFALELADNFRRLGQRVETFDLAARGNQALTDLIGRRFKAVIGIQSYIFHILMQDGTTNLHNLIHGPKYQMILDHPAWLKDSVRQGPDDYRLLIHDRYYMQFAKIHYPAIKDVLYFPPGGSLPAHTDEADQIWQKKIYDISFIGTYRNYRERLSMLYQLQPEYRHLAAHFLKVLREQPDLPAEHAFSLAYMNMPSSNIFFANMPDPDILLSNMPDLNILSSSTPDSNILPSNTSSTNILASNISSSNIPAPNASASREDLCKPEARDAFLQLFYEMRQCCFCIMLYYREQIIRTLLEAGLTIHVYSDSWKNAPFAHHPGLVIHPALSVSESLEVMQQSRISLNIMSWHKDGLTERILNSMLCQSVVVSDRSLALEEFFSDGEEILLFSLKETDRLPAMLKELLQDDSRMRQIMAKGYQKACEEHLWIRRAKQLLEEIEQS